MTELEEKIYANGSLKLSRTLTKGITPANEIVLSRLRTERDYAVENNYITENGFFIADEEELSYHTGLSEDAIRNIVSNLIRRNLIDVKVIQKYYLVCIYDKHIIRIVEELETDEPNYYGSWDKGLKKVQQEILKLDILKKENNNETTVETNKKNSGFKVARKTENVNSDDKSTLSEHMQ